MPKVNHGRKRDLHPELFHDERVLQVELAARWLFIGLWTIADRKGRMEEPNHLTLKVRFLPVDHVDCAALLGQLVDVGLVVRYMASTPDRQEGYPCLWLPGLVKRTRFHPNEMKSALPPAPGDTSDEEDEDAEPPEPEPKKSKKPKLPPRPQQPELPAMTRERSTQEQALEDYKTDRRTVLEDELHVPFVEDEEQHPAFVNVALGKILKLVERFNTETRSGFERLTALWWEDSWGASLKPPFPFKAFVSDKTYPRLIEKLEAEEKRH